MDTRDPVVTLFRFGIFLHVGFIVDGNMKRLVADGIARSESNGKVKMYQLTHEAANTLEILNAGDMPETEPCGARSTARSG
jgi:hypothetical protein